MSAAMFHWSQLPLHTAKITIYEAHFGPFSLELLLPQFPTCLSTTFLQLFVLQSHSSTPIKAVLACIKRWPRPLRQKPVPGSCITCSNINIVLI